MVLYKDVRTVNVQGKMVMPCAWATDAQRKAYYDQGFAFQDFLGSSFARRESEAQGSAILTEEIPPSAEPKLRVVEGGPYPDVIEPSKLPNDRVSGGDGAEAKEGCRGRVEGRS